MTPISNNMDLDYYQILGVDRNATSDDINDAYQKLVGQLYPEGKFKDGSSFVQNRDGETAKCLIEAYEVLSNHDKRMAYNQDLDAGNTRKRHPDVLTEDAERSFRKMEDSSRKKIKVAIWAFSSIVAVLLIGALLTMLDANKKSMEYMNTIPVAVSDTLDISGVYSVSFLSGEDKKSAAAEFRKTGEDDYVLNIYTDGPVLILKCSIISDGVIYSDLWGDGTIVFTPSQNKIKITFNLENNTICELVK